MSLADLDPEEMAEEVRQGGRLVVYYYCVTLFFWSYKKPSRIVVLRPRHNGNWFWRGLPYSLLSLVFAGPLVALGGLALVGFLFTMNYPGDPELNVLIVLPTFVLTFWGLPWGYIYLFSCVVSNCCGGQDVTAEVGAMLAQQEMYSDKSAEANGPTTSAPMSLMDEGKLPT